MPAARPAARAAVFDMDGLLIDSEPLWRRAEIETFADLGVTLTEEECLQTMGLRIDELVAYWRRAKPWDATPDEVVVRRVQARLIELVHEQGAAMPGAHHALAQVVADGLPLAIASSSATAVIAAVLETLGIAEHFTSLHSAVDEVHGKPDPAVYLRAAAQLGLPPTACVAFEDSPSGVRSARAAAMTVIAVPAPELSGDPAYELADHVLDSLEEVGPHLWR